MILVSGSSRVEDASGDTIPPALPVLCSLFNLAPADAHFPEIFLDDIFPVLSRSTWTPPETIGFPYKSFRGSRWWSIRERCPSHLRRLLIMSSSFVSAVVSRIGEQYIIKNKTTLETSENFRKKSLRVIEHPNFESVLSRHICGREFRSHNTFTKEGCPHSLYTATFVQLYSTVWYWYLYSIV